MGAIGRGFHLLGASWTYLKSDRQLLWIPFISLASMLVALAMLGGIAYTTGAFATGRENEVVQYLFFAVAYFVVAFIGIFFNAAIVGAAMIRIEGGDPTVGDGIRKAAEHLGKIAAWSALSASVGLVLHGLEERAGFVGRFVIAIIGAAWGAVTFLVVPVLLFEPLPVGASVKRSAQLFKERWGEQVTANAGLAIAMFLLMLPMIAGVIALCWFAPVLGIIVGVAAIGAMLAIGTTLSGIFNAALYKYAVTGAPAGPFSAEDLAASFKKKKK